MTTSANSEDMGGIRTVDPVADPVRTRAAPTMEPCRFVVTGGRYFNSPWLVSAALGYWRPAISELIVGYDPDDDKFQGLDQLAYEWAKSTGTPVRCFAAEWSRLGLSAGPRRNTRMADERPKVCLSFVGGRGTADMTAKAERAGAEVINIRPDGAASRHTPKLDQSERSE